MTMQAFGWDLYARHTGANGASYVQAHRVWDKERFLAAQQRAAERINADQPPGQPRLAKVEQITQQEYAQARRSH